MAGLRANLASSQHSRWKETNMMLVSLRQGVDIKHANTFDMTQTCLYKQIPYPLLPSLLIHPERSR